MGGDWGGGEPDQERPGSSPDSTPSLSSWGLSFFLYKVGVRYTMPIARRQEEAHPWRPQPRDEHVSLGSTLLGQDSGERALGAGDDHPREGSFLEQRDEKGPAAAVPRSVSRRGSSREAGPTGR